jgi:hypothetical protein
LENYRVFKISNFKLNYGKAGKSTSQGAFRIELRKSSFSKTTWKKARPLGLAFSKENSL